VSVQNLLTSYLSASRREEKNICYNESNKGSKFNTERHCVNTCQTKSVGDAVFLEVIFELLLLLFCGCFCFCHYFVVIVVLWLFPFCYYCFVVVVAVVDFVIVVVDLCLLLLFCGCFRVCYYCFVVDFVLVVADFVLIVAVVDFVLVISIITTTSISANNNILQRQRTKYTAQSTLFLPALCIFTSNTSTLSRHALTLSVHKTIHSGSQQTSNCVHVCIARSFVTKIISSGHLVIRVLNIIYSNGMEVGAVPTWCRK
jgi:hypothetical protein